MAFKVLLTNSCSDIGSALLDEFENLPLALVSPDFTEEQWADESVVRAYLADLKPAVVINTLVGGAKESLSSALREKDLLLPRLSAELDMTLIHLSSHLVFAAEQRAGEVLSEQDSPVPDSEWGQHLLDIENTVLESDRAIVLRLPWLLDSSDGVIYKAANALLSPEGIRVSEFWRGTPVFVEDVVRAVIAMTQQILCGAENWGVFHFHSSDSCSEAEFSDYIARVLSRKGCTVGPVDVVAKESRLFSGNGWLVGNRCTNCFGIQFKSWRQGTKGRLEFWLDRQFSEGVIRLQERAQLVEPTEEQEAGKKL